MRFNCGPTAEERETEKFAVERNRRTRLSKWHNHLAWLPIRVNGECVIFETVERRFPNITWRDFSDLVFLPIASYWDLGEPQYRLKDSYETH